MMKLKLLMDRRALVLLALAAAAVSAAGRGNALAYLGMTYYFVCAVAVFRSDRRAGYLLWLAVAVHLTLVAYSVWRWQALAIIPCHFCMAAAGFALLAATAWYRRPLVVLPALLMISVWLAWPLVFAAEQPQSNQPGSQVQEAARPNEKPAAAAAEANGQPVQIQPDTAANKPAAEQKTTADAGEKLTGQDQAEKAAGDGQADQAKIELPEDKSVVQSAYPPDSQTAVPAEADPQPQSE